MKTVSRILIPLYSLLMTLALALASPWWLWQMLRTGKHREGLGERLGRAPERLRLPPGPETDAGTGPASVWVHAVSVGEVLAVSHLVEELGRALPGVTVCVSTTTRTGQALARERFGSERVFYFPLDFAFAMRSWLRRLRPTLMVLVESEFWPRMILECRRAGVPVAVVNARISDRSWPRYRRLGRLWRPLLGSLNPVLAQSERDAERLRALGASGAIAAGNLKYDIRVASPAAVVGELRARLEPGVPVVVCGSTLGGEEDLLLDALPVERIVTILAPRHPERFESVARLAAVQGRRLVRRSSWYSSGWEGVALRAGTVVLLDSVGELASVYSLATLAVLGGGFLWPGGHNPLEPAQFGVPVLMGAQYANFRAIVAALQQEQAVVLSDPAGLRTTLAEMLANEDRRRAIGERGRQVFAQQSGATARALRALLPLIRQSQVSRSRVRQSSVRRAEVGQTEASEDRSPAEDRSPKETPQ